jgi:hypothetical protein
MVEVIANNSFAGRCVRCAGVIGDYAPLDIITASAIGG